MQFITGNNRQQTYFSTPEDQVAADNPVRLIDAFIDKLDLQKVEPVWGTLINFMGMKRINARGLAAANKTLILAAACYNLKKWLRFTSPAGNIKTMKVLQTKAREFFALIKKMYLKLITWQNAAVYFLPVRNG